MIMPDFKNSIVNISSTFSKWLGKENGYTIPELENELNKEYKNVVFIIFDGMGIDVIKKLAKNTILDKNIVKPITSVFPSTTTNATTSLATNLLPCQHKWTAWSVYIDKIKRCQDIYLSKDSYTGEMLTPYREYHPLTAYYKTFKPNRKVITVFPDYVNNLCASENYVANDEKELAESLKRVLKTEENKFIYAYCPFPDMIMHEFGVTSVEAKEKVTSIVKVINELADFNDTLIVISADHGHIDVKGYVDAYKDEKLLSFMARPFSMEPRACSFKIKKGQKREFVRYFKEKYSADFTLKTTSSLIKKGVFGDNVDREMKNILGDYIAIGKETNKLLVFSERKMKFKGHHTSLTKAEMLVPLILIKNKKEQ